MTRADDLIGKFINVKKIKNTGEVLYNVLMEDHDQMVVNNLVCETLDPTNVVAKLYKSMNHLSSDDRDKLMKKVCPKKKTQMNRMITTNLHNY